MYLVLWDPGEPIKAMRLSRGPGTLPGGQRERCTTGRKGHGRGQVNFDQTDSWKKINCLKLALGRGSDQLEATDKGCPLNCL